MAAGARLLRGTRNEERGTRNEERGVCTLIAEPFLRGWGCGLPGPAVPAAEADHPPMMVVLVGAADKGGGWLEWRIRPAAASSCGEVPICRQSEGSQAGDGGWPRRFRSPRPTRPGAGDRGGPGGTCSVVGAGSRQAVTRSQPVAAPRPLSPAPSRMRRRR